MTNYIEDIRTAKNKFDVNNEKINKIPGYKEINNTLFNYIFSRVESPNANSLNKNTDLSNNTTIKEIQIKNENNSQINFNEFNNSTNPFDIFNSNIIRNIGLINIFLIKPVYYSLKRKLETSIYDSLEFFKLIYIIIISVCISGVLFIYLFIWRPFVSRLNVTVIFNNFF